MNEHRYIKYLVKAPVGYTEHKQRITKRALRVESILDEERERMEARARERIFPIIQAEVDRLAKRHPKFTALETCNGSTWVVVDGHNVDTDSLTGEWQQLVAMVNFMHDGGIGGPDDFKPSP